MCVLTLCGPNDDAEQVSFVSNCVMREQFCKLDFSGNFLGRNEETLHGLCQALACVVSLDILNLSGNAPFTHRISAALAHSLPRMTRLKELRIAANGIHAGGADALACTFVQLTMLEHLDISQNRFTTLPVGMSHACAKLVRLNAQWNPWTFPPPQIMAKNTLTIKDHMYELHVNGELNREMTLVLVGSEETGKSSIVNALEHDWELGANHAPPPIPIASKSHTRGAAFSEWRPGGQGDEASNFPVFTVWDLGGLCIYRSLQEEFFMLRRALYCLTWRPHPPIDTTSSNFPNMYPGLDPEGGPYYRVRRRGLVSRHQMEECLRGQVCIPFLLSPAEIKSCLPKRY